MNEENGWLVVPMLLGAVVIVSTTGIFLMDNLPRRWDFPVPPGVVFVGGIILATSVATAVIMAVAITKLGCC